MSLKPEKAGDRKQKQKLLNEKLERKKKKNNDILPPYTAIFCEGTKTEPYYFDTLANIINKKYGSFSRKPRIVVNGMGTGCTNLMEVSQRKKSSLYKESQKIWFVYDKDDFDKADFDKLYFICLNDKTGRENAAWSNECIELWFLLHLQPLNSALDRNQLCDLLKKRIGYEKNNPDTFNILRPNLDTAIARAEKLLSEYPEGTAPSNMNPSTNVFALIKELLSYL